MPKFNHPDLGDIQSYVYLIGKIVSVDAASDTAKIQINDPSIEATDVPIRYHCTKDAVARDNGALEGAAGAFSEGDEVIVRCKINNGATFEDFSVIGFTGDMKECSSSQAFHLFDGDIAHYARSFTSQEIRESGANGIKLVDESSLKETFVTADPPYSLGLLEGRCDLIPLPAGGFVAFALSSGIQVWTEHSLEAVLEPLGRWDDVQVGTETIVSPGGYSIYYKAVRLFGDDVISSPVDIGYATDFIEDLPPVGLPEGLNYYLWGHTDEGYAIYWSDNPVNQIYKHIILTVITISDYIPPQPIEVPIYEKRLVLLPPSIEAFASGARQGSRALFPNIRVELDENDNQTVYIGYIVRTDPGYGTNFDPAPDTMSQKYIKLSCSEGLINSFDAFVDAMPESGNGAIRTYEYTGFDSDGNNIQPYWETRIGITTYQAEYNFVMTISPEFGGVLPGITVLLPKKW